MKSSWAHLSPLFVFIPCTRSSSLFVTMLTRMLQNLRMGIRFLGLLVVGAALVGCGGSQTQVEGGEDVPEWYLNTPEDPNYVFAAQSATSQKMQVALDKATTNGRGDLAASLETKIESMTKSFTEEVGDDLRQQYTEAQKEITSRVLKGTSPKEKEVYKKDNGTWRAFVLMELPVGEAAKEFMSKLNSLDKDDEMYTRFRASEAFDEMEEAVEDYEEEQGRGASSQSQNENQ